MRYLCRCTKALRGWCLPCSRQNFLERVGLERSERGWAGKGAAGLVDVMDVGGRERGSRSPWAQGTGGAGRLRLAEQGCGWTPGVRASGQRRGCR